MVDILCPARHLKWFLFCLRKSEHSMMFPIYGYVRIIHEPSIQLAHHLLVTPLVDKSTSNQRSIRNLLLFIYCHYSCETSNPEKSETCVYIYTHTYRHVVTFKNNCMHGMYVSDYCSKQHQYLYQYIKHNVYLTICLSIYLSICLSSPIWSKLIFLIKSIYQPIDPHINREICVHVCIYVCYIHIYNIPYVCIYTYIYIIK
jgi:hypothetical protein